MLKIAFPVWSLALFIRRGSERLSTLTTSDPPWRTKLLHHWGFSKDCAMRSGALLEESVGLLSSVAGIKYEFLACLFGRGQDTFGCANSGLVKIPILKHGQQTCHTPPHPIPLIQPKPCFSGCCETSEHFKWIFVCISNMVGQAPLMPIKWFGFKAWAHVWSESSNGVSFIKLFL